VRQNRDVSDSTLGAENPELLYAEEKKRTKNTHTFTPRQCRRASFHLRRRNGGQSRVRREDDEAAHERGSSAFGQGAETAKKSLS